MAHGASKSIIRGSKRPNMVRLRIFGMSRTEVSNERMSSLTNCTRHADHHRVLFNFPKDHGHKAGSHNGGFLVCLDQCEI